MPAEKSASKYYRGRQGALLPLELRQSTLENRRRTAGMEFRQGRADVHSFPHVRNYLTKVIDDYEKRFGKDDAIFEAWHKIRIEMLDTPLNSTDFMKKSKALSDAFDTLYFTDETGNFSPDEFQIVQPVITEISNIVSRGK